MTNRITFTDEQSMLLDTAMDFCQKESPLSGVRQGFVSDQPYNENRWQSMSELGWLSISIPEEFGGLGMGLAGVVPVIESMGRQLMASPFLATTLAAQALINGGSAAQKTEWLPKISGGAIATLALQEADGDWNLKAISAKGEDTGEGIALSGTKTMVLDAESAELVIVSVLLNDKTVMVCVEASQIPKDAFAKEVLIDETRTAYQVKLDGIVVPNSAILKTDCFQAVENAALLLLSAEMAGGIASTLNTVVGYLQTRKQFGKLIGSYQALKHPTVDILIGLEEARSLVYGAATIFDSADEKTLEIALRMAKASVSESFSFAGDRAVQFHGGFGFTYDCDAQMFLRRALWSQHQFGDERHQRQLLAPLMLDA